MAARARLMRLVAVLALATLPGGAAPQAQNLVADLSHHLIAITTGFIGTQVVAFGVAESGHDVIVTVQGPREDLVVRRKSRIAGVWVNRDRLAFRRVPAYYAVASTGPLQEIARRAVLAQLEIGTAFLDLEPIDASGLEASEIASFRDALVRRKQEQGLYSRQPAPINFIGEELFRTNLVFPGQRAARHLPGAGVRAARRLRRRCPTQYTGREQSGVRSRYLRFRATQGAPLWPGGDRAGHRRRVAGQRDLSTGMNMSEQAAPAAPDASPAGEEPRERIFLVVVDETEEMKAALRFACRRALHTGGRVALFYAIEPPEFQHWQGVERVMQEEARQHAEQMLQELAAKVQADTGKMPILYLREGRRRDELLALIAEEPGISLLVLGMASGREGPGPLVSYLVSQGMPIRLPLTLVPGALGEAEIDAVT